MVVHAPAALSEDRIHEIVTSKERWIQEKQQHPQKFKPREHPPGKEVVNGESALYLGRGYKIELVDNLYRGGSCTPQNNLHLNWRLIKAPTYVIDYMIVHELAHLREPNHTPRFWNIVRAQCPKMEQAKSWLKEHGQLLEEEF